MSVTVYPYISDELETFSQVQAAGAASSSTSASSTDSLSFQETLQTAQRALQAMAVDALLAASESGSLDVATIQEMLGFNPTSTTIVANSKLTDDTETSEETSSVSAASSDTSASSDELACSSELEAYFAEAAETYGVDVSLLKAIAKVESNFDADATSSAGAMGIMQLMPSTAESLGIEDAYDAYDNIMGGAQVIAENLERYDGDVSLALAAYNAGCSNVDKYGGIPPFEETENYVEKVLAYYNS